MEPRIILLADGPVGLRTVQFFLSRPKSLVVGVVTVKDSTDFNEVVSASGVEAELLVSSSMSRDYLLEKLGALQPDIVITAWWPLILSDELGLGQKLTLNLHPSLLPYCRGKDPNFWALADREPFGVTLHHVVREVDAGPIAFQKAIAYDWTDTGKTLYVKAGDALLELIEEHYAAIVAFRVPVLTQAETIGSHHYRRELDPRSTLSLTSATTVGNLLTLLRARTFPPYPGCRFVAEDGNTYQVRVEISRIDD